MALISSDLPRENSATKATITLSDFTCPCRRRRRSSTAASSRSWSFSHSESNFRRSANSRRQAPCWSNCSLKDFTAFPCGDYGPRSAFLAMRAVVSGALALADGFDRRTAHTTGLAGAVVHHRLELEVAGFAPGI